MRPARRSPATLSSSESQCPGRIAVAAIVRVHVRAVNAVGPQSRLDTHHVATSGGALGVKHEHAYDMRVAPANTRTGNRGGAHRWYRS